MGGKGLAWCSQRANVAISFIFHELAAYTQYFRAPNLIGEGGFGTCFGCWKTCILCWFNVVTVGFDMFYGLDI